MVKAQLRTWTQQEILETLAKYTETLRRMGVRRLGLIGSYRYGTATPDSDMDFLLIPRWPSFDDYMSIQFFLEDLFGCSVDLIMPACLKPHQRAKVMEDVLYVPGL